MPSYGEYQKPAGVLKSCGCDSMCGCSTKKNIPGIENNIPYKGNAVLNANK
jgi:hypothetical protein|tara:strand:+ start:84 stop:236 length:153 start_codon:yes stop_codon:yes gene_type:complete